MPPRHTRPSQTSLPGGRRVVAVAVSLVAAVGGMVAVGPSAAVDPCTVTWDGGASSTRWQEADNWSTGDLPGASDVVCIPAGASPRHELGDTTVAGIRGEGALSAALACSPSAARRRSPG